MPFLVPFRIEVEFVDKNEYASKQLIEDGLKFCDRLEQSLSTLVSSERDSRSSVTWVDSRIGSLTHWGYFALHEDSWDIFFDSLGISVTLADLLRDAIDQHYSTRLEYYDARIGRAENSRELSVEPKHYRPFRDFWEYKVGTINQRADYTARKSLASPIEPPQSQLDKIVQPSEVNARAELIQRWRYVRIAAPWILIVVLLVGPFFWRQFAGDSGAERIEDKIDRMLMILEYKERSLCCPAAGQNAERTEMTSEMLEPIQSQLEMLDAKLTSCFLVSAPGPETQSSGWGEVIRVPEPIED
jgi:hypothetical protein